MRILFSFWRLTPEILTKTIYFKIILLSDPPLFIPSFICAELPSQSTEARKWTPAGILNALVGELALIWILSINFASKRFKENKPRSSISFMCRDEKQVFKVFLNSIKQNYTHSFRCNQKSFYRNRAPYIFIQIKDNSILFKNLLKHNKFT